MRWLAIVAVLVLGWSLAGGAAEAGSGGGFLGVQLVALTPEAAANSGIPVGGAVLVDATLPDSPAAKAGLAAGQVIMVVDGERVAAPDDVVRVVSRHRPGDVINLLIKDPEYGYMASTIRATLGEPPAAIESGDAPAPAPKN